MTVSLLSSRFNWTFFYVVNSTDPVWDYEQDYISENNSTANITRRLFFIAFQPNRQFSSQPAKMLSNPLSNFSRVPAVNLPRTGSLFIEPHKCCLWSLNALISPDKTKAWLVCIHICGHHPPGGVSRWELSQADLISIGLFGATLGKACTQRSSLHSHCTFPSFLQTIHLLF